MNIQKELARLDELRQALLGQLAGATSNDKIEMLEEMQPKVKPGTQAHADLLATGYGMTVEEAQQMIAEREANPQTWPFDEVKKAKAMLAAFKAKPEVISTRLPWRVRSQARSVRA